MEKQDAQAAIAVLQPAPSIMTNFLSVRSPPFSGSEEVAERFSSVVLEEGGRSF